MGKFLSVATLILGIIVCPFSFVSQIFEDEISTNEGQTKPPCVAILEPVKQGEQSSEIVEEHCFAEDEWAEYVEFVTGGSIEVPEDITPEEALQIIEDYNENLMEQTPENDN